MEKAAGQVVEAIGWVRAGNSGDSGNVGGRRQNMRAEEMGGRGKHCLVIEATRVETGAMPPVPSPPSPPPPITTTYTPSTRSPLAVVVTVPGTIRDNACGHPVPSLHHMASDSDCGFLAPQPCNGSIIDIGSYFFGKS